jgi:hypothetical protein
VAGCQHQYTCPCNPADQNNTCTDNNVCNGLEACGTDGQCHTVTPALNCDDNNPCTVDSCDSVAGCQPAAVQDGTSCSDGNVCNGNETCSGGACQPGTPINCDDGNPCTADSCDTTTGQCVHTLLNTGSCGTCTGGCDDGNPCTTDSCDTTTGQCVHTPLSTGSCDDRSLCTFGDTCSNGSCVGTPTSCNDSNPCTVDTCDPSTGCVYTPLAICPGKTLCTLTQGGYSASNGNNIANGPNGWVTKYKGTILPVAIGLPGTGLSVTIGDQPSLEAFLPTGGQPNVLCGNPMPVACPGNLFIPPSALPDGNGGDGGGTLSGQAVALSLSVALSNIGANPTGLGGQLLPSGPFCTTKGQFVFDQCILNNAGTVGDLLNLANQALAGIPLTTIENPLDNPQCLNFSEIESALDTVNMAFDGCRTFEPCL